MRCPLVVAGALMVAAAFGAAAPVSAHALFPGSQTVRTTGDRAFVTLHAVNGRKDVSSFVVEVFEYETWRPYRLAVATPQRLVVPAQADETEATPDRQIRVLVDLDGQPQRRLRVCTKSVVPHDMFRAKTTEIATRVCANVLVERF